MWSAPVQWGRVGSSRQIRAFQRSRTNTRGDFDRPSEDLQANDQSILSMKPVVDESTLDELSTPDEFIQLATELEDVEDFDAAIEVYRAMSLAFGPSTDVSFRLAELCIDEVTSTGHENDITWRLNWTPLL